jgi:hypothetical protein
MKTPDAPCDRQCRPAHHPEDECRRCAFLRDLAASPELGHRISDVKRRYCFGCAPQAENFARRIRRLRLKEQGAPVWQRLGFASVEAWRAYHRHNMVKRRAKRRLGAMFALATATTGSEPQQARHTGTPTCAVHPQPRRKPTMSQTTIRTASGKDVTGEVTRRQGGASLGELFVHMATGTLAKTSEERVTVRDAAGNHWSGTRNP